MVVVSLGRECQIYRESAAVAQKVCEDHQLTAANCPKLGAGRKQKATRELKTAQERKAARVLEAAQKRREGQYLSLAPQYQNQLEARGQIVDVEVEDELLV